jgi:hypothetical protein
MKQLEIFLDLQLNNMFACKDFPRTNTLAYFLNGLKMK